MKTNTDFLNGYFEMLRFEKEREPITNHNKYSILAGNRVIDLTSIRVSSGGGEILIYSTSYPVTSIIEYKLMKENNEIVKPILNKYLEDYINNNNAYYKDIKNLVDLVGSITKGLKNTIPAYYPADKFKTLHILKV